MLIGLQTTEPRCKEGLFTYRPCMPVSNTVHDLYLSASSLLFKSHLCPNSYPWVAIRVLLNKRLNTSSSAHCTFIIPRPVNRGNRHLFLIQSTDSYRKSTSLMRTLRLTVCCNNPFFFFSWQSWNGVFVKTPLTSVSVRASITWPV